MIIETIDLNGYGFPLNNLDKQEKMTILFNFYNNSRKTIDHSKEVLKSYVSYGYVVYEMPYKNFFKISRKMI